MQMRYFVPLAIFVTACTPVIQTPQQTAGVNPVEMTETRGALSGTLQQVDFYYSINPACGSEGFATIRVIAPPKNGQILVEQGESYTNFKQDNVRYACNTKKVPGTIVKYQSTPGFVGTDMAMAEVLFSSGGYRKVNYIINVR